jgi:Bacteriophage head to tail connecting protein
MQPNTPRDKVLNRWSRLKTERSSWDSHYREISEYLLPRSGRFFTSDRNKGKRKHHNIYDSTGTRSLRVLAAGMMAGMTSPARPWFRLSTSDPNLDESANVKKWLAEVTRLMLMVFSRGNTYRSLHTMYEELGAFGTGPSLVMPDFKSVIHHYPLTVGEYAIATDYRGQVNTIYREFDKTVAELVGEFGKENCSKRVQNLYTNNNLDEWITVVHAIEPRTERDTTKRDSQNMPFKSCYFEMGSDEGRYLRESGFKTFRAVVPRWATSGGDIYGNSPGMEALGDIKQLQHEQLRKAQTIDYQTNPPLQVPSSMKSREVQRLPGGITYVDNAGAQNGIRSAFDVNLRLDYLLEDIRDVRERIRGAFYADLFLMLANNVNTNMTATEVAERHEEKLLMLGPVLERLHNELLDPLIEMTFDQMLQAGIVPPPPEELQGVDLNVEFVSMLAQAQRAVATNSIDRFVVNLGSVAQFKPGVLDKFDEDKWADEYADMLGVDPELIVPGDKVALIRKARAEAAQAQQQMEMMQQGADTARNLASAKTGEENALTNVIDMFSGYTTP